LGKRYAARCRNGKGDPETKKDLGIAAKVSLIGMADGDTRPIKIMLLISPRFPGT
jgi:hypothetical protein